jgi:hypothetical protein
MLLCNRNQDTPEYLELNYKRIFKSSMYKILEIDLIAKKIQINREMNHANRACNLISNFIISLINIW